MSKSYDFEDSSLPFSVWALSNQLELGGPLTSVVLLPCFWNLLWPLASLWALMGIGWGSQGRPGRAPGAWVDLEIRVRWLRRKGKSRGRLDFRNGGGLTRQWGGHLACSQAIDISSKWAIPQVKVYSFFPPLNWQWGYLKRHTQRVMHSTWHIWIPLGGFKIKSMKNFTGLVPVWSHPAPPISQSDQPHLTYPPWSRNTW